MILTAALALLGGCTGAASADEPFKPYVACIAAVSACSTAGHGAAIRAGVIDLVVLKAARDGQDGFYVFAPEDAYFHPFPAPPPASTSVPPPPSLWNLYGVLTKALHPPPPKPNPYLHFRVEAGLHETVFVTFRREESGEPVFEHSTAAAGPSGTEIIPAPGGECHADAQSRALLVSEALERVKNVVPTYTSSPEPDGMDVANEINIVGHDPARVFYKREVCRKGLEACLDAEDLKAVAAPALEKLKP